MVPSISQKFLPIITWYFYLKKFLYVQMHIFLHLFQLTSLFYTSKTHYFTRIERLIKVFAYYYITRIGDYKLLLLIFGPHVLETMYTSFEPSARVQLIFARKLTKMEREIFFFETLFELFSALFILPLCCQNHQVFLD